MHMGIWYNTVINHISVEQRPYCHYCIAYTYKIIVHFITPYTVFHILLIFFFVSKKQVENVYIGMCVCSAVQV